MLVRVRVGPRDRGPLVGRDGPLLTPSQAIRDKARAGPALLSSKIESIEGIELVTVSISLMSQ